MVRQQVDEALADFEAGLEIDPNDAVSHTGRGGAHLAKQEFAKAVENFTAAAKLLPATLGL
jgi:tetratricopeptide (TPR) repeat protein